MIKTAVRLSLLFSACFVLAADVQTREGGVRNANRVTTCGNAFYDDGTSENAAWFGGGLAGDPDFMFGVLFNIADFGFTPGAFQLTTVCAGNDLDFGGPWPNRVFVYNDVAGTPDDGNVLGFVDILTGDGAGQDSHTLGTPILINGDFWLMCRGDAAWDGEDFNMEFDTDGAISGNSFVSSGGIAGLTQQVDRNYVLRGFLESAASVPTLGTWGLIAMVSLLLVSAMVMMRRRQSV